MLCCPAAWKATPAVAATYFTRPSGAAVAAATSGVCPPGAVGSAIQAPPSVVRRLWLLDMPWVALQMRRLPQEVRPRPAAVRVRRSTAAPLGFMRQEHHHPTTAPAEASVLLAVECVCEEYLPPAALWMYNCGRPRSHRGTSTWCAPPRCSAPAPCGAVFASLTASRTSWSLSSLAPSSRRSLRRSGSGRRPTAWCSTVAARCRRSSGSACVRRP